MKNSSPKSEAENRAPACGAQNIFYPQPSALDPGPFTRRAFTLIEVMVSIAIFALLVTAVYSTWVLIIKSAQVGQEAAAQVQRERIAVRTIEDSLTCIQSFQASMQYYTFLVDNGQSPQLSFVARVPDVFPRNGRFGDFNLRRLTFTVEAVSDSEKDLVLRQNPILMDVDPDEQSTPLVLARNVQDFIVECWDTNALDWVDTWDNTNALPPMVRVTLALGSNLKDKSSSGPSLAIAREIAMPSGTMPNSIQGGQGGGGGINIGGGGRGGGGGQNGNGRGGNNPVISPGDGNRNNSGGGFGGPGIMPPIPPNGNHP
jgi:prepilin-type N-terminal cleavage/methylation domain-containing protein